LVRTSGMPYTIVRPAWFDYNAPDQQRLVMLQGIPAMRATPAMGSCRDGQIGEVLVQSLTSDAALGKTFELVADRGPAARAFDTLCSKSSKRTTQGPLTRFMTPPTCR
jgi:uncharacterized protein YbjT (DUF2867 family)